MDPIILHSIGIFFAGFVAGIIVILLFNKLKSGSASAVGVKNEYDEYKTQVESHFEETSKKFKEMTEQYQDLYQHLAVGATSLCRPDSVAASLADGSNNAPKLEQKPAAKESDKTIEADKEPSAKSDKEPSANKEPSAKSDKEPSANKNQEPTADTTKISAAQRQAAEKKVAAKLAAEKKG